MKDLALSVAVLLSINFTSHFAEVWHPEDGVTWHESTSTPIFSPRYEVTPYVFDESLWVVAGNATLPEEAKERMSRHVNEHMQPSYGRI